MDLNTILAVIAILVGLVIAGTAGYYVLRGQKASGESDASVTTVTMLSGQIAALTSAQQLASAEIKHLKELLVEKDRALAKTEHDIERLQQALTQRAEVEAFRKEATAWLRAIAAATGAREPVDRKGDR